MRWRKHEQSPGYCPVFLRGRSSGGRPPEVAGRSGSARRRLRLSASAAIVALFGLASAFLAQAPSVAKTVTVTHGGVYRAATTSFGLTANLDPTGEDQPGFGFGIFAATIRTLVGFNGQQGASGIKIAPELATTVPTPTDNGLTYTFHLKSDIKFGPPVNREITSQDIAYAFQRINDATLVPQYGYYYDGLIVGLNGTATNPDTPISGIDTPNATTIVFHLTRPQGDFLQLLAMPATAPIPPEVGKCFLQPATYGRDLISSGPYMFQGSASVNITGCSTITPMSGFNPTSEITLVRNPNYVASTGDTPDYLNGVQITIDPNVADIFEKVQKGELDGSIFDNPPATVAETYLSSPSLKKYFHSNVAYWSESITMNLAVPPFTNIHVRKAVEWVLDRNAMTIAMGGKEFVSTATHINPPGFPGSLPATYNPYPTANNAGDLAKAKAQMKLSPYDPKDNGECNVAACKNLIFINIGQFAAIDPIVQTDLAKIGIDISPRVLADTTAFLAIDNVKGLVPMSALGGGYSDYTGANSFAQPNFGSTAITGPSSCCNYSLVGLTKAQAQLYGVPYPKGGIPSVDSIISKCQGETGSTQDACFEKLDKVMMTSVAAWAPYMWGHYMVVTAPTVTRYVMSQSTGSISLDQIAVDNHVTLSS